MPLTTILFISLLTCVCIVFGFRFVNKPHKPPILGVYQQKNKFYYLKFLFMYIVIRIRQAKSKFKRYWEVEFGQRDDGSVQIPKNYVVLEETYDLGNMPMAVDGVYFNGASKTGASVICGLARRPKGICNTFLYLKVEGGDLLLSPNLPNSTLQQTKDQEGRHEVEGIKITNLMPMRAWNISYSGNMKLRNNPEKTVNVEFSLSWSAHWRPFNYDTDISPLSLARDTAREMWSADYFKLLQRYHQTHYEQMGRLEGNVTIDGQDHKLSMPCVRDHTRAPHRDWRHLHRYVLHFIHLDNGDSIAVGSVSKPVILSHLTIGYYCRNSDGAVLPITYNSFLLYQHGENGTLPKDYGFVFKTGCKSYTVQVLVNDEDSFLMGEDREATIYERWCSFEVNGISGWGVVECEYKNANKR